MNRFIPYCGNGRLFSDADYSIPADEPNEVITDASKPTRLFLFIEQRDWNEALVCLRKSPHQVTVWVRQQSSAKVTIWNMLPLHAAVAFGAPLRLIEKLVTVHPNALRKPDHDGKLPLHYAAIFSNRNRKGVMSYMLKHYPESIWIKDACGRTAIEFSCNDELQTSERIRMRKKLSGNSDNEDQPTLDTASNIGSDGKENEQDTKNIITMRHPTDAHGEIAAGSDVSQEGSKTTISNVRAINRNLIKKKMPFQIKTKRSRETHALVDKPNFNESNETEQDEGVPCLLNCSAHVEEVDQSGRRTVYLNFALSNEDQDDDDESKVSVPQNTKEDVSKTSTSGIPAAAAAAAKHNTTKNKTMKVLQTASIRPKKRQKVSECTSYDADAAEIFRDGLLM
jgi:hypothetical protein